MEKVTIVVNARDRFSPTTKCLETLLANTPEPFDLLIVMGGAPEHLKSEWSRKFGHRGRFIFKPEFLNDAQARNLALRETKTPLAVVMGNDVFVRPGWLTALVECQKETGAVMVVPLILERERRIHTAGNDLYITYEKGKAFGHKHSRFYGKVYADGANLKRQPVDYGELHCRLIQVEPTLRLVAYDKNLREVGEVDSGLTWSKAGYALWTEPNSVVLFDYYGKIAQDDIKLFVWRWDMRAILEGYRYFEKKWGLDITEHGIFGRYLFTDLNAKVGLLPRLFPSAWALALDRRIGGIRGLFQDIWRMPKEMFRQSKARWMGYDEWLAVTSK